jgi:uncharacterized membrane protein
MAKIYYVGDWAILTGPTFMETPFLHAPKGLDIFNYGKWLKEAIESTGEHKVISVPSWDFYKLGPGEYENVLEEYDLIIFSDVEAKLFQLAPSFFDREKFGKEVLTFPDRIRLSLKAGRTELSKMLPVKCLDYEDLIESTEGYTAEFSEQGQTIYQGINLASLPPILGYNKTLPLDTTEVLARFKETGDPMLAWARYGKGKVLVYTSDPAPHWGCNFVFWDQYADFWGKTIEFLLS